ncbi:D-2-hydroxyacid dehydrogenase family protein [uncultured Enterovirga sp.]|uniref:D-2-hydroxyacid dehydrogenase family protein n=1 Tax=uncultured Enterovirga sp. TaxID=2026352 RepID=UPI0035CA9822
MAALPRVAVIDDTQRLAGASADWDALAGRADIVVFDESFADEDDAAQRLAEFDAIVPMRERTAFPASLVRRLPKLRLLAMTGTRAPTFDIAALTAQGVLVCNTGINTSAATAELAFGLILACARDIPLADRTMRSGGWHEGVPVGTVLDGKRLGILGLGKLGARVAGYGRAFGMEVVAWSQNLTDEAAAKGGARRVDKAELFGTSDILSVHLVLSDRTRGIVGAAELGAMRDGAILVNTSRGPLVDEAALLAALESGRIRAGLDVYDREPLPADHPLRTAPNVVLTPHLGYGARHVFEQFYRESVENIAAWLDDQPIRVVNPEVLATKAG